MPTFDFLCQKCNHTFEFSRSFGSKEHPACPECTSKETEKLISPPVIHFKGSGFYKTDGVSSAPVKNEEEKTEAKTEEKTETKPDAKPKEEKKTDTAPTPTKESTKTD